ncbi:unnamed protein product, partial [Prorocentrum cordatum]
MASSPAGRRLWSTCAGCHAHQWNDVLLQEGGACRKCGRPVKLFKPKGQDVSQQQQQAVTLVQPGPKHKGKSKQQGGAGGTPEGALDLLSQTIAATTDPTVKRVLESQQAILAAQKPVESVVSADEAVRKASGAWKDAEAKHAQSVDQVLRCRAALVKAEAREAECARTLAQAEFNKQIAIKALANASGLQVQATGDGKAPDKAAEGDCFRVEVDETFFASIQDLECEEGERKELAELEKQLRDMQTAMATRSSEVKAWVERTKAMEAAIQERLQKKRKVEAGGVAGGAEGGGTAGAGTATGPEAAAPEGASAPPPAGLGAGAGSSGGLSEEALAARAKQISEARLAGADAARQRVSRWHCELGCYYIGILSIYSIFGNFSDSSIIGDWSVHEREYMYIAG